jgi:hypothetical protein
MAENSAAPLALAVEEQPTAAAELKITERPAQLKITGQWWGTAEGNVPPSEAHHLITTFGLVMSAFTGAASSVVTLRIDPHLVALAVFELIFAAVVAGLIAFCARHRP